MLSEVMSFGKGITFRKIIMFQILYPLLQFAHNFTSTKTIRLTNFYQCLNLIDKGLKMRDSGFAFFVKTAFLPINIEDTPSLRRSI